MKSLDEMVEDIESVYLRYYKKNRGTEYVFARLWEDYFDGNLDEEMMVYNLIIAKKNIQEKIVTRNNWNCIARVLKDYERKQKKVADLFDEKDSANIYQMYSEVKNAEMRYIVKM